jgi:hypothetical protein
MTFNATILRRIYGGILDNLSMPSILVHVYLTTKSTVNEIATYCVKCLEYTRGGVYWRRDKSGVHFTHECVKCTQIANPERTRSERRADPERTQGEPRANPERTQNF